MTVARKTRDAVQFRCPDCGGKVDMHHVVDFSAGKRTCRHCNTPSRRLDVTTYRAALARHRHPVS